MKLNNIFEQLRVEAINELSAEQSLSKNDKLVIDYILGETLNEADGNDIINRLVKLIDSGKKGLITAAVIAALTSSAAFNSAYAQAPSNIKAKIENATKTVKSTNTTQKSVAGPKIKGSMYKDNFSNNFKSGNYELNPSSVTAQLNNLKQFLSNHPDSDFKIQITASESRVPNQSGFGIGELAAKRAETLVNIVKQYLSANGFENIEIVPAAHVGTEKWVGDDKNDPKYTKDQYVQMDVLGAVANPEKKEFKRLGNMGDVKNNFIDTTQVVRGRGNLVMSPGEIPDRLVILNNGNVVADTGYFVDVNQTRYNQWTFVPLHVAHLTKMLASAPNTLATKVSTIKSFQSFEELISYCLKDKKYNYKADERREIRDGLVILKQLWDGGQKDFMFYTFNDGKVSFDLGNEDKGELRVYSPMPSTQYSYSGKQMVNGKIINLNSSDNK